MAKALYYPGADTKAQDFSRTYPGAPMSPNVLLLHTTEGTSWPGYAGGGNTPHFTMRFDGGVKIRQHLPVNRSARALRDIAGGVVTNRLNVVQVELVATSGWASTENPRRPYTVNLKAKDLPEYALRAIAALWVWLHREWGVPLTITPRGFQPWNARRPTMTHAEWNNFRGLCGHQHAPENDHTDPGSIDANRILAIARELLAGGPLPQPVGPILPVDRAPFDLAGRLRFHGFAHLRDYNMIHRGLYGPAAEQLDDVTRLMLASPLFVSSWRHFHDWRTPRDVRVAKWAFLKAGVAPAGMADSPSRFNDDLTNSGPDSPGRWFVEAQGNYQAKIGNPVDYDLGPKQWAHLGKATGIFVGVE